MSGNTSVRIVGKKIRVRIPELYVKQNWGVPFMIVFILLLAAAVASSTSYTGQATAESEATWAAYALLAGVVLQVASFLKYKRKDAPAP